MQLICISIWPQISDGLIFQETRGAVCLISWPGELYYRVRIAHSIEKPFVMPCQTAAPLLSLINCSVCLLSLIYFIPSYVFVIKLRYYYSGGNNFCTWLMTFYLYWYLSVHLWVQTISVQSPITGSKFISALRFLVLWVINLRGCSQLISHLYVD